MAVFRHEISQRAKYPITIRFFEGYRIVAEFLKPGFLEKFQAGPRCPDLRAGVNATVDSRPGSTVDSPLRIARPDGRMILFRGRGCPHRLRRPCDPTYGGALAAHL